MNLSCPMSWYMKCNCGYACEFSNNTNCKTDLPLSHHTKVYMVGGYMVGSYVHGGQLRTWRAVTYMEGSYTHGGSHKITELSKLVGRRLHRNGCLLGTIQ